MTYVEFFGDSYILAFCSFFILCFISYVAMDLILKINQLTLRTVNILCRGYPLKNKEE